MTVSSNDSSQIIGVKFKNGEVCGVCLESFQGKELKYTHTSGIVHGYHQSCLTEWLARSLTCPTCRAPLSDPGFIQPQRDLAQRIVPESLGSSGKVLTWIGVAGAVTAVTTEALGIRSVVGIGAMLGAGLGMGLERASPGSTTTISTGLEVVKKAGLALASVVIGKGAVGLTGVSGIGVGSEEMTRRIEIATKAVVLFAAGGKLVGSTRLKNLLEPVAPQIGLALGIGAEILGAGLPTLVAGGEALTITATAVAGMSMGILGTRIFRAIYRT